MLKWSLSFQKEYAAAIKAGNKWIGAPCPEVQLGFVEWYEDFWRLSTDRQIGMAVGPIPHGSILRQTEGWPCDDADMFDACIRAMDSAYLAHDPKKVVVEVDPLAAFNRMFPS